MGHKTYSNTTCPNRRCDGKCWRRSSLLRTFLNLKHHTPQKSMYSEQQIIKILEICFQNMNCFYWIKLIPVPIYLKYWYYDFPYLELPCLPHHLCQISSLLKPLFITILNMFSVKFPILSYPIWPHTTTSIGYTKPCAKPSKSNLWSSYIQMIITYGPNTLPIKKLNL